MAKNPCIAEASQALGRELTDDEAITLFEDVQKSVREAENAAGPYDEAIKSSKERMILEKKTAAFIEKRNAYIQFKLRREAVDFILTQFPDNPALGIEALLVGVNRAKMGSRFSAAAISKTLFNKYAAGLITELQTRNFHSILTSGDFDQELYRALYAVNRKQELPYNGSKEVLETARTIKKYFELMRHDYNVSGANIDMLEGYMGRQSHDSGRIKKAGEQAWIDFILPKLDIERTFEGEKPREILAKIYNNFISGNHLKTSENVTGFKGGTANLGKKASQDRVLHFKDADSWYEYNLQFGTGSLSETILRQMSVTSQNVGLMRVLGPNPKDNFNRITGMVANTLKGTDRANFDNAVRGYLSNRLAEVDGTTRVSMNDIAAQVSSGVRAIQTMADLGGAVIASVTDLAAIMTELRYQGFDMFDGLTESIAALGKGRNADEMAEIDSALGVIFPSLIGEMHSRFIAQDGPPGMISKGMQLFFKYNGMSYWTEVLKATASRTMSHMAALNKNKTWDELHPDTRRVYSLSGIDAEKWDMFRQTATIGADGKEYLLPNKLIDLPDQVFADYLIKRGQFPSEVTFKTAKGSEYKFDKGKSIRNKKERADVGHEGDAGIKPQSLKTVFLTEQGANALGTPSNVEWRFIDNNDGTVSLAVKNKDGKWGMSPSQKNIKYTTEPSVGAIPLELWGRGTINEMASYKEIHFGNKIVEITKSKPTDTAIAELKREVETQWRTYFTDRADFAVLEPDARTQSIMNQGHQPGTPVGEALRFIGQYKSFPVAFVQKVLGREIYGRGSDTLTQALKNGNGEMTGLMQVMVWSTIFGYGAMNAKAILAGKEPRKPEDAKGYFDLVKAAMLQGGGAGIYGDFLFGEMKSRYGAGPLETFLGPTFSNLSSLADLYGRAMKGDDVAGSAVKFVINNTPGNNIWWAKAALDYGIIYRLQEGLNPGYLKRMETRIKKEQDQSFIFPPSQVIR
jgi:hypothetical protein